MSSLKLRASVRPKSNHSSRPGQSPLSQSVAGNNSCRRTRHDEPAGRWPLECRSSPHPRRRQPDPLTPDLAGGANRRQGAICGFDGAARRDGRSAGGRNGLGRQRETSDQPHRPDQPSPRVPGAAGSGRRGRGRRSARPHARARGAKEGLGPLEQSGTSSTSRARAGTSDAGGGTASAPEGTSRVCSLGFNRSGRRDCSSGDVW